MATEFAENLVVVEGPVTYGVALGLDATGSAGTGEENTIFVVTILCKRVSTHVRTRRLHSMPICTQTVYSTYVASTT